MPEVKPLKTGTDAKVRQPKAPFRALPANSLHVGPSGSGKTLTLLRTLMDADKLGGCFDKYLLFSPNIFVGPQYQALVSYVAKTTGQRKEDFCFDEFDHAAIRQLMEDQKKVNAYLRKIGSKRLLSACVVCDDFGEWHCTSEECEGFCPLPKENVAGCPSGNLWAKNPETGKCCKYQDYCAYPTGWVYFQDETECKDAAN